MNKKIFRSYIFLLGAVFVSISAVCSAADEFVLVLDPGHGGHDPGAIGKVAKEKEINLAVSLLLGDYVESEHKDVKIVYTRKTDRFIELKERTNIANKANANLFISIHTNASPSKTPRGAEVYILGESRSEENLAVAKRENSVILLEENQAQKYEGFDPNSSESNIIFELMQNIYVEQSFNFATKAQKQLVKTANRYDRGVRQAGFWVLVGATMPRVLIELDFISTSECEKFINSKEGQVKMARAIANAFSQYKKEYDNRKTGSSDFQNQNTSPSVDTVITETISTDNKGEKTSVSTNNRVYKVQILASTKKLGKNAGELKGHQADYYIENNLYKYTYGETSDWNEISAVRKSLLKDFKDAFIITFENGVKIPNK